MGLSNLPTKWADVRLKQYMDIVELSAIDMDELDKSVKILSILSGVKEDVILNLPLTTVKAHIRKIQFIYTKPAGNKLRHHIKLGSKRFVINYKLSDLTGGEYIDMVGFTKEPTKVTSYLPSILAIYFKPVNIFGLKKKSCYDKGNQTVESRIESAKLISDHLTMDEVVSLSGFFLRSYEALTKVTLEVLQKQNEKIRTNLLKKMKKEGFSPSMDGNTPSTI